MRSNLDKPRFGDLPFSECGGAPILRTLWDKFDFSLLLSQAGIMKRSGAPAWMLCFLYVIGLTSGCTAVSQMASLAAKDAVLRHMFKPFTLAQYTLSRLFTTPFAWRTFGKKRVARLQQEEETMLREGDVINLDDTHINHSFAKKMPYLCWLKDSSTKAYSWCMNLVVLQAVLQSGLEYPLTYSLWRKAEDGEPGLSKLDLAKQMLLMLRESTTCRLWVAMDRWYLCKDFFVFLMTHNFDWVTKAKRNTALFRRVKAPCQPDRYVPISARQLIKEVYKSLIAKGSSGLTAISLDDVYMKLPYPTTGRKGQPTVKHRYVQIAAVVAIRLKEDEEATTMMEDSTDALATYKGAYLIISNRYDVPKQALEVYSKRWRIEVFFRAAKQELGFEACHSTTEAHHHAHFELLFATETLLAYALWQINKEKTSDESCTHGEMVRGMIHTRCQVRCRSHKGSERIYLHFDIEVRRFASFISTYWPPELLMTAWPLYSRKESHNSQLNSRTA